MKNKFKALIAAFIGLFTFSVVGVGVNAVYLTEKYSLMNEFSSESAKDKNVTASNKNFGIFVVNGKYRYRPAGTELESSNKALVENYTNEFHLRDDNTSISFTVDKITRLTFTAYNTKSNDLTIKNTSSSTGEEFTKTYALTSSKLTTESIIIQAGTTIITAYYANILDLVVTNVADGATASFKAQYSAATPADSTKLRFIATINGISYDDYKNIASIAFTFKFITDEVRVCNVSYVYKSIINSSTGD